MLELEENLSVLKELSEKIKFIRESMKIDSLISELKKLEEESMQENFWDDISHSNKVFSKINTLKRKIQIYTDLDEECNALLEFNELLQLEYDEALYKDLIDKTKKLENDIEKMQVYVLFTGKYDANNCKFVLNTLWGNEIVINPSDYVELKDNFFTDNMLMFTYRLPSGRLKKVNLGSCADRDGLRARINKVIEKIEK